MYINLITGYKGSGKDTLHTQLVDRLLVYKSVSSMFNYAYVAWDLLKTSIIGGRGVDYMVFTSGSVNPAIIFNAHTRTRAAFADRVKKYVHEQLNIPDSMSSDKDALVMHPDTGECGRLRHFYVKYATFMRENYGDDYWAVKTAQDIKNGETGMIVDVTDFRFKVEEETITAFLPFDSSCTIRIFRGCVDIPPLTDTSEHDLDGAATDMLLVPNIRDYYKALALFPQYENYTLTGVLEYAL